METKQRISERNFSMNLITKLPEYKDPVIGICFENEFEAAKTNADLVDKYFKDKFTLTVWPADPLAKSLNAMLVNLGDTSIQRLYKNLGYDYIKFNWWLDYTKNNTVITQYSFVHVVSEFGKHRLINTYNDRKRFVIKVTKVILREIETIPY